MSKIEQLIQQYCPEGVEYVKLGEIVSISRGASPRPIKNFITDDENGIPWIKIGDVSPESKYILSTKERITKEGADKSKYLQKGAFILSNSMSFGRPYILGIDGCIHDGWISMNNFKASINSSFLYYLLRCDFIQGFWASKANNGGAVTNLNSDIVRSTPIPLPPLPVQEEIVRILDTFSELQMELQTELQARQQQYQFYRDKLLSFEGRDDVEWKKLGEICEIGTGSHNTQDGLTEGLYSFYTRGSEVLYLNDYDYDETAIITAGDGAGVGKVFHFVQGKYALHQRAYRIVPDNRKVVARYLYYYIGATFYNYIMKSSVSSSVVSIRKPMMLNYPVPVPPISVQEEIVSILDRFDTLVNDLSQGLPAEIAARRQQYEFYRDKLLTFKKK